MGPKKVERVSQFVSNVLDYSSEYGDNLYAAKCVIGEPSIYPKHGDKPNAWSPRFYGDACTTKREFLVLEYATAVMPEHVKIYETFNPGSVVAIWVWKKETVKNAAAVVNESEQLMDEITNNNIKQQPTGSWHLFWRGKAEFTETRIIEISAKKKKRQRFPINTARVFTKTPMNKQTVRFLTNKIRLEFDAKSAPYFPQIDAVELCGPRIVIGTKKKVEEQNQDPMAGLTPEQKAAKLKQKSFSTPWRKQKPPPPKPSIMETLGPLIFRVLGFLDWKTRLSIFFFCSKQTLDLAWNCSSVSTIDFDDVKLYLNSRKMQKLLADATPEILDCQGCYYLESNFFVGDDMVKCLSKVRKLVLSNCPNIGLESLESIAFACSSLEELDLSSMQCSQDVLDQGLFAICAGCENLRSLNLYHTQVSNMGLSAIIQLQNLENLDVGSCIGARDAAICDIIRECSKLTKLRLSRCFYLTDETIHCLADVAPRQLSLLDLSWLGFSKVGPGLSYSPMQKLIKSFGQNKVVIKELSLTSIHIVDDRILDLMIEHLPKIKKLELLGTMVTKEGCDRLIESNLNLQLIDLSFVHGVRDDDITPWKDWRKDTLEIKRRTGKDGITKK